MFRTVPFKVKVTFMDQRSYDLFCAHFVILEPLKGFASRSHLNVKGHMTKIHFDVYCSALQCSFYLLE